MPLPLASFLHDRFLTAIAKGRGDIDWSGIAIEVAEVAGLKPEAQTKAAR